jgi:hypothetical protein
LAPRAWLLRMRDSNIDKAFAFFDAIAFKNDLRTRVDA